MSTAPIRGNRRQNVSIRFSFLWRNVQVTRLLTKQYFAENNVSAIRGNL